MGAMTLVEYAKMEKDNLRRGVTETFAAGSPVLGQQPFKNISDGAIAYNQEKTLPGIGFRAVNGTYTPGSGIILPLVEKVKIMGGEADTDIALIRRYGEARRSVDINMKVKAAARYYDKVFIDGDEATDVNAFDGLNKRLTGNQLIYVDGSGTAGGVLTDNAVQRLIDAIDGKPDLLLMGKKMRRQLSNLYKLSIIFGFTDPAVFGSRVETFDGIPLGILDKDNLDATILGFDETVGSTYTNGSIYAIKFGADEYLSGIQTAPPDGKDLGEISSAPVKRYRFDWDCGIVIYHPRCAARLAGVAAASGIL